MTLGPERQEATAWQAWLTPHPSLPESADLSDDALMNLITGA